MLKNKSLILTIAVLIGLLSTAIVFACSWDYDTLKMERSRFPSTLELITGKFLRHTPEFYEWRIKDRLKRLEKEPNNLNLLDDLAVAYDKTGQHDKAIETAINTEKMKPDRYETLANLGTFYFHSGKLEEGLPYIDKALKINPDAHFGREYYQKALVEYLLQQRKKDSLKLPLADIKDTEIESVISIENTFENFLLQKLANQKLKNNKRNNFNSALSQEERLKAIKGILGMMRFGTYNSPILLEALGSLLAPNSYINEDAKLLGCRSFLKASYELPDGPSKKAYQKMALSAIDEQAGFRTLNDIEPIFKKELDEAQLWYNQLRENELSWIREGKNPELEFDKLYDADPELSGGMSFYEKIPTSIILSSCLIIMIICSILWYRIRQRRIAKLKLENK